MIAVVQPSIGTEERRAIDRVLSSGNLAQGTEVETFESEFSAVAAGGTICVAVNSGTSALHLSMLALGIGPGDEVLVPSFTFAATANSVALTGARPVFVDIDPETYCISVEAVRDSITPKTRAVMPVHLYGNPADLRGLERLCSEQGLVLLEDAAQAHLASLDKRLVGTWGVAGSFSFYPTKNMTSGEGGMIVTSDEEIARRAQLLRNQGQARKYHNEIIGFNNRMTDIHAAIGRVQLTKLIEWTKTRRRNARLFDSELKGVVTPKVTPGAEHAYHQYTIRIVDADRDEFATELAARGVGTGIYYPIPNHRLPSYRRNEQLPETERACREVLSLPIHPSLSEGELEHIIQSVNEVASAGVGGG